MTTDDKPAPGPAGWSCPVCGLHPQVRGCEPGKCANPPDVWQGSNDGVTWASMPGAGPLLVAASHRYAREIDGNGTVLRYGEVAKPPGAPKSKYGE